MYLIIVNIMEKIVKLVNEENTSEVKFMNNESLAKLFRSGTPEDIKIALIHTFRKYPKLMKHVMPCVEKGQEGKHCITLTNICRNSPLYDLGKKNSIIFDWEEVFDYLWT